LTLWAARPGLGWAGTVFGMSPDGEQGAVVVGEVLNKFGQQAVQ
jgi:hypothetical protein